MPTLSIIAAIYAAFAIAYYYVYATVRTMSSAGLMISRAAATTREPVR